MQQVERIAQQKLQIGIKCQQISSHQQHYQNVYHAARLRMQGSQQAQVQAVAGNAAALQQYQQQSQQSQQIEKSNYRQSYQALKYFHLQEQKTMYLQEQMRSSKYYQLDEERLRKQAASTAAQQVKMQFQVDEQPFRRDLTIDYRMETKIINGQQHSDLNRASIQQQAQKGKTGQLPNSSNNNVKYPVSVTLPVKQWDNVRNFRPFLESATPDEKLSLMQKTLFKPKKRLRKLIEKRDKLVATKLAQQKKYGQQTAAAQSSSHGMDHFGLPNGGPSVAEPAQVDLVKCPVYKCTAKFALNTELDEHYSEAHKDLIALGISLG